MAKVAEEITGELADAGVRYVFGLAGDSVIPIMEAIRNEPRLTFIGVRNEGAAGFMACAYAKVTNRLGVCLADAGPGSTNMLTGVYDACQDRVPVLAITGEVEAARLGIHWPQDADESAIYQDATVYNQTVYAPEMVRNSLAVAIRLAYNSAGVSRLGFPVDLQKSEAKENELTLESWADFPAPGVGILSGPVANAVRCLEESVRPLIFVGRGAAGAETLLEELAAKGDAGIVHTIPAFGMIPPDHPRNLGVAGEAGTVAAATALREADLILVVGSSWWQPEYISPKTVFIQVDIRPDRIGMTFPAEVGLSGDAVSVLGAINEKLNPKSRPPWVKRLAHLKAKSLDEIESPGTNEAEPLHPAAAIRAISRSLEPQATISLDVGEHTYWFGRDFQGSSGQRVLISGHWRAVGSAFPAAIAAKLAQPERQTVAVVGDGGFNLSMAELVTAVQYGIPVTVVVFNNGVLAEEKHNQTRMKVKPYGVALHNPDFVLYAKACGAEGYRATSEAELADLLLKARHSPLPVVIDVPVKAEKFQRPPMLH